MTNTNHASSTSDDVHFFTILEAAEILRISPWTIQRLIQQRKITSAKIGNRRLIPADGLHSYIERATEPSLDQTGGRHA